MTGWLLLACVAAVAACAAMWEKDERRRRALRQTAVDVGAVTVTISYDMGHRHHIVNVEGRATWWTSMFGEGPVITDALEVARSIVERWGQRGLVPIGGGRFVPLFRVDLIAVGDRQPRMAIPEA